MTSKRHPLKPNGLHGAPVYVSKNGKVAALKP